MLKNLLKYFDSKGTERDRKKKNIPSCYEGKSTFQSHDFLLPEVT